MNNKINDGGPAFPADFQLYSTGMTLRDYFAASALNGLIASVQPGQIWSCEEIGVTCYRMADAMIKAREAKP
jgi:hypothetical protein